VSDLASRIGLFGKKIITFTGSGGKTTLMFQLARELVGHGKRIVTTTTTKIHIPSEDQSPHWMTIQGNSDGLRHRLENLKEPNLHLTLGWRVLQEGKLEGIPLSVIEEISRWDSPDMILIEADGSRGKGLKGHSFGEPVLPECTDIIIVVVALDELGRPYDRLHVHRSQIIEEITGLKEGDILGVPALVALLLHEKGYLNHAGAGDKILILNKILDSTHHREALKIAQEVQSRRSDVKLFFRGPLYGTIPGTDLFETMAAEKWKTR
jgi:probable selenium-dependent hydroxylase accessory protein YqeC